MRQWRALVAGIALAVAAFAAVACGGGAAAPTSTATAPTYHAAVNDPPLPVPPLTLTADTGQPFDLASLQGDVVALFFGYTSCPDVCPLTLSTLTAARRALPETERDEFRVVFVTVDPERDTLARLADYLPKFDASFIGVGGAPADVEATLQAWGVQHERVDVQPDGSYAMSHPSTILLLDRAGRWALTAHSGQPAAEIAEDVARLLAQPALPADAASAAGAASAVRGLPTVDHGTPAATAAARATPAPAAGGPALFLAYPDGSVTLVDPANPGAAQPVLPSYAAQPPPDDTQGGTLRAREVAYDPQTGLLWYAETHDAVHSVRLATGEPGPSMTGFGDVGIVGCSILGNAREIVVDPQRRLLILPELTGAVLTYDLDTLKLVGGIGPGVFGDIVLGGFRHMAVDPTTGNLWWAAANGDFVEYDLAGQARTGRVIHTPAQAGALENAYRDLAIDPVRNLLIYEAAPGQLAAVNLVTLAPAAVDLASGGFTRFSIAASGD